MYHILPYSYNKARQLNVNIPAGLNNLVNGLANNSSLFLYAIIGIGIVILVNDFKGPGIL